MPPLDTFQLSTGFVKTLAEAELCERKLGLAKRLMAALGTEGARVPLDILTEDVDRTLAQIGCADIRELGPHYLYEKH